MEKNHLILYISLTRLKKSLENLDLSFLIKEKYFDEIDFDTNDISNQISSTLIHFLFKIINSISY